jgi:SAM-dependent methyltransferase
MAAEEGFNVMGVDFSIIPIDIMRKRATQRGVPPDRLQYDVADVRNLEDTFAARAFDVVVDKGLLDVLLNAHDQVEWWRRCNSGEGSTSRKGGTTACGYDGEEAKANAVRALTQISRVLRPGGVLIMLSYEPPKGRNEFLTDERFGWRFQTQPEEDEKGNFLYVLQKELEDEGGGGGGGAGARIITTYDPDELD